VEHQPERRRARRFPLQQSALVQFNDGTTRELTARTENVSLRGALVSAPEAIPEGVAVTMKIFLQKNGLHDVALTATGKVIYHQPVQSGGFGIAVAFEKPLTTAS